MARGRGGGSRKSPHPPMVSGLRGQRTISVTNAKENFSSETQPKISYWITHWKRRREEGRGEGGRVLVFGRPPARGPTVSKVCKASGIGR